MNLLKDKREQERLGEFNRFTEFDSDNPDRDELPRPTAFVQKKRRGSMILPLLATVAILAVAAAGYYFGFYKPSLPAKPQAADEVSENVPPTIAVPETIPATDQVAQPTVTPSPPPEPQSAEATASDNSLAVGAKLLTAFISEVRADDRMGSIFIDDGAFSAEITSLSAEGAKAVYNSMIGAVPGVTVTSQPPNAAAMLLTGTFDSGTVDAAQHSSADLQEKVRSTAQSCGLALTTTTVSEQAPRQMFVKMSGSLNGCREFLALFSQQSGSAKISKIILMPAQANEYTFVLRLLI